MSHRSRSLLLAAIAAATAALAPAAHATPPGANGPLFLQAKESTSYSLVDPDGGLDQPDPQPWDGGPMLGVMAPSPDGLHLGYFSGDANRIAISDIDAGHERPLRGTGEPGT